MAVRVALIGVGRWGKHLLRVLASQTEVAICCNKSNPVVHGWIEEHYPHVQCTYDYQDVLRDVSIQAVIIATPIETHGALVAQALEAGKHVFVEKPLANNVQEARELVDNARRRGLVLFVGHIYLYHPVFQQLMAITEDDPVVYTHMIWTKFGGFEDSLAWDLVTHDIAIALKIFSHRPNSVTLLHCKGIVTSCDVILARLGFGANKECIIEVNRCAPSRHKNVTVVTASGQVYSWEGDILYSLHGETGPQVIFEAKEEPLALEAGAFLRSVQTGVAARSDGAFGLMVVEATAQLIDDLNHRSCVVR